MAEEPARWWEEAGAEGFNFRDNAGDAPQDNTDEYVSTGSEHIGASVLRCFGRGIQSYGRVVSWLPGHLNEGEAYYRVKHDDGDEEDLDEEELAAALRAARETPRPETAEAEAGPAKEEAVEALKDTGLAPEPPEAYADPQDDATKRAAAAWRGVAFVAEVLSADQALEGFGGDAVQALHDVATTAPDPLKALALYHAERCAQRWKAKKTSLTGSEEPPEVADLLGGVAALACAGAGHAQL
eukprot:CAMPEP_0119292632 /NCGR_PEP_ID=MMETSP1329-20130426/44538_1 /TAXON_ID=114041 /ORGANISM="Genus nov. species nov., Strain RCC1024" /LENGTH=240 /DNA_ID=CAMNT_0007293479 /DNA_START=139 /DNA_END=857 /DNA_ORIENTATION=+